VVEELAGFGIPKDDIASTIINPRSGRPIDANTLRLAFREELRVGSVKANARVAGALFKAATEGNVTAQIWWTKARMGWNERVDVGHDVSVVHTLQDGTARQRIEVRLNRLAERIGSRVLELEAHKHKPILPDAPAAEPAPIVEAAAVAEIIPPAAPVVPDRPSAADIFRAIKEAVPR
jgi:hypothetical protein